MTRNHTLTGIGFVALTALGACTVEPGDPPAGALGTTQSGANAGGQANTMSQQTQNQGLSNQFVASTGTPQNVAAPSTTGSANQQTTNNLQGAGGAAGVQTAATAQAAGGARPQPGQQPAGTATAGTTTTMAMTQDTATAQQMPAEPANVDTVGTVGDMTDTSSASGNPTGNPDAPPDIPIEADGWFDSNSNLNGFTGAWYCYDDGLQDSSCVDDETPYVDGMGMCLTGETIVDDTYKAWGAGIAVSLFDKSNKKNPYDADAAGITGFEVTITGDTDGADLLMQIPRTTSSTEDAPQVLLKIGTQRVDITDAVVPDWATKDPGETPNTDALYELKFKLDGAKTESSYNFCVTSVVPY